MSSSDILGQIVQPANYKKWIAEHSKLIIPPNKLGAQVCADIFSQEGLGNIIVEYREKFDDP